MNIKINEIKKDIFLLKFKNQYDITSTFMRLQEYYESPYKGIKGCYFTLEEYMDRYAKENGNFTYTIDWAGFNVPDNVIRKFFTVFSCSLLNKEKELFDIIMGLINSDRKFYLLAIYEEEDLDHEISHGYYYLDDNYKENMDLITKSNGTIFLNTMKRALLNKGYCEDVIKDEIQAYLSTSDYLDLKENFNIINMKNIIKKYRKVFQEKDKQYKNMVI